MTATATTSKQQVEKVTSDGTNLSLSLAQENSRSNTGLNSKPASNPLSELAEAHKQALVVWVGVAVQLGVEKSQIEGWLSEIYDNAGSLPLVAKPNGTVPAKEV